MNNSLKSLLTPLALVGILGGCTVLTEGPKFLWAQNADRKARELNWVCLGKSEVGQLVNPITWFITGPNTFWFANPRQVGKQNYMENTWVIQTYRADIEDGQWVSLSLLDTSKKRWAYLGDPETDDKRKVEENFDNPEWKNVADLKNDAWIANAIDWINNGKPISANYCD